MKIVQANLQVNLYPRAAMDDRNELKTLADRLRYARMRAGLSQPRLAEMVGTSQQTINSIENGTTRSTTFTARLAHALGVEALWLESGDGPMIRERAPDPIRANEAELEAKAQELMHTLLKGQKLSSEEAIQCYRDMLALVRRWAQ